MRKFYIFINAINPNGRESRLVGFLTVLYETLLFVLLYFESAM